jgi:hypothetical protein
MSLHSSTHNGNGNGVATEQWEPESPFLSDFGPSLRSQVAAASTPSTVFGPPSQHESPFIAEYAGEVDMGGPRAERFAGLVSELSDTEFSEALEDLVNEAAAVAEDRAQFENEDPVAQRLDTERAVRAYLQPIARHAEEMLEQMAEGLSNVDLSAASEGEVETLLEQFQAPSTDLSPVAEQFLGGLMKKAKGLAKIASKVTSLLPHNLILNKLKPLVRPLLERVLRVAINKVPVALQPIAKQLAKRFLGVSVAEAGEMEDREELAAVDPEQLEEEFDSELAGYVMDGEDFDREAAVERAVSDQLAPPSDPLGELARSRKRFAQRVTTMAPTEDVGPAVEEFVPVIMAALKLGIKIIGRPKVVKFLAGLVANFIKKYIGPEQSMALSGALVDAGLKLASLETENEAGPLTAGYALGATVEDTINRLVQDVPEAVWENEPMLAAYTYEAFQQAASAHFPDTEIRDDLHEAARTSGAWVPMPANAARKTHKKYSRALDIVITPQVAASVQTFGGVPLRNFLRDRMGVAADQPVRARAYLYEATPGTMLGVVSMNEKRVPGLGTAGRTGRSQFHPLTPQAAGSLFGEPGLGRPVGPRFLAKRGRVAVGQRFYHLDIPGARVKVGPRVNATGTRPARSTQPKLVLDFPKHEIRVCLFLSEADAQKLASQVRQKAPLPTLLATLKSFYDSMLKQVTDHPRSVLRIIHESAPVESMESPMISTIVQTLGRSLVEKGREWLLDAVKRELETRAEPFVAELERVTAEEADGVTIRIVFQAPIMEKIRRLFKPTGLIAIPEVIKAFNKAKLGDYRLELRPGFAIK